MMSVGQLCFWERDILSGARFASPTTAADKFSISACGKIPLVNPSFRAMESPFRDSSSYLKITREFRPGYILPNPIVIHLYFYFLRAGCFPGDLCLYWVP